MRRYLPLLVVLVAMAAIAVLSVVPAWLIHNRVVMGEGSRLVVTQWNAWQRDAVPVISLAVVLGTAVGAAAVVRAAAGGRLPATLLVAGSAVIVGLLLAAAWPLDADLSASRISLSAGSALIAAIVLAVIALVASATIDRLGRRWLAGSASLLLVALVASIGCRALILGVRQSSVDSLSATYVRDAADGSAADVLEFRDGRYSVSDRWSGTFESYGLTVTLLGDPACPNVRGAYHLLPADTERRGERVRLDVILDRCADGQRADDLEVGVWVRQQ